MLVEEALPRAVVSRLDCVDGWKHTIQAPVDEGAGHTAELAASIGHVEEADDLLASGSAVAHVEFIDPDVVALGDRAEQSSPVSPQVRAGANEPLGIPRRGNVIGRVYVDRTGLLIRLLLLSEPWKTK